MNHIEKEIFDTLAHRKGINLPGLGSLSVVHVPAEFITDTSIRPPQNKIIFSRSTNPQYASAGDLKGYGEWLQHISQGNGIREIGGVGILKGNIFYPSVELHEILNPHGTQPVAVKPWYGAKRKIAVGIGVVAAAVAVIIAVILIDKYAVAHVRSDETPATAALVGEEAEGAAARGESTIGATVAHEIREEYQETSGAPEITETVAPPSPDNGAASNAGDRFHASVQPAAEVIVANGSQTYYLVVGVFSDPENADRLISRDPLQIGIANYEKTDFSHGRILVSAFSSTDREKVERRRRELKSVNGDLWIYEKR